VRVGGVHGAAGSQQHLRHLAVVGAAPRSQRRLPAPNGGVVQR
jgi:hypothetical protein